MAGPSDTSNRLSRAVGRALRFATLKGDRINSLRRHAEMLADQAWVLARAKRSAPDKVPPFDGTARFALITVNFSTTYYLKLMLLTLAELQDLQRIRRLIIVDNDSRDGGLPFLRELTRVLPCGHLIEHKRFPTHARGLRNGFAALDRIESTLSPDRQSNILLPCDTDIIFRNPLLLGELAAIFEEQGAAFAGELRRGLYPYPEAQASFFAVRRDVYARDDVAPIVHHGAPAYFMQRSLWKADLPLVDFPSNHGGHILHRGRSGVAASRTFRPRDPNATAAIHDPHYMGVPEGELIWGATEARYARLLAPESEAHLLQHLGERLANLGAG